MRRLFAVVMVITVFLAATMVTPCAFANSPQAVTFMVTTDPWLMVIGSDAPSFALYDDGTVIFQKHDKEGRANFLTVQLTEAAKNELLAELSEDLKTATANRYVLTRATDQPSSTIWLKSGNETKRISVYGQLGLQGQRSGSTTLPPGENSVGHTNQLPKPLLDAFQKLASFDEPGAKEWLPPSIEVMIWPFDYSKDKSIDWPQGWPDTTSASTTKRGESSYSVFLESSKLLEFKQLMRRKKTTTAIRMNGKKWAISYRYPFPDEEQLRKY